MGGKNENTRLMVWNLSEQLQKQTGVVKTMLEQIIKLENRIHVLEGKLNAKVDSTSGN